MSHDIVRAVTEGIADIGIIAGNERTDGLQVVPYRTDRLVLVAALTHPLAKLKKISFDRTLDCNYIGLVEASAIQSFLNQAANALHKSLRMRIQVSNFEALCRMIETNVGVGVIPESAARRHGKTMAIQIVPLTDDWALRDLKICMRNQKQLPLFARELIDLLVADAASTARAS